MTSVPYAQQPVQCFELSALFWPYDKIFDAPNYFGQYRVVLCMGTDPVRTVLAIHRCLKFDCTKKMIQDGFVSYDFKNGHVFDVEEEVVLASKRACGTSETLTSVNLPAIPVSYQTRILPVTMKWSRRD